MYKIKKNMLTFTCLFIITIISGLCLCYLQKSQWKIRDTYGQWKVVRLIGAYQATKGELPYGTNIGRSFVITKNMIKDSTDLQEALEEDEEQRCFSMNVTQRDESVFEVDKPENIGEFQVQEGIILDYVGFKHNVIYKYTFNTQDDDDYHTMPEFSVYTYNDKDQLLVSLPMGYYLLERFKEQKRGIEPYGCWMVSYRTSKGNSKEYGIEFMDYYGQCFEITEDSFGRCDVELSKIKWEVTELNKVDFEQQHGIQEGLGINNEMIDVWFGVGENDLSIMVIPINGTEIIMLIDGQWFVLKNVNKYQESKEEISEILKDNWKFEQLVAAEEVDPCKEICGASDYKAWWYTQRVLFDSRMYAENAVSDWIIEKCSALEFYNKYDVPDNVRCLFQDEDFLQVAIRKGYGIEEIYVLIDKNTIIRGRNGLWYILRSVCR